MGRSVLTYVEEEMLLLAACIANTELENFVFIVHHGKPEHLPFGRDSAIIRQSSDPESTESSVAYRMRVFGHDHSGLTPGMSDQDKSMPGMSRQEGSPREMEAELMV